MAAGTSGRPGREIFAAFTSSNKNLIVSREGACNIFSLNEPYILENPIPVNYKHLVRFADKMDTSPIVVYVPESHPRNLVLNNVTSGTTVTTMYFPEEILAVRVNQARLVACTEESIRVYELPFGANPDPYFQRRKTVFNPAGVMALSNGPDGMGYLAYPGSNTVGVVIVISLKPITMDISTIKRLHEHPLRALAFNSEGSSLVSVSTNGTVVRVWSCPDVIKLHEFRRGLVLPVTTDFLGFSPCSSFVIMTSNSSTAHIFKVTHKQEAPRSQNEQAVAEQSWGEWLGCNAVSLWSSARSVVDMHVLPSSWCTTQQRSYAKAYVPAKSANCRKIAALLLTPDTRRFFVVTDDGLLYAYLFSLDAGDVLKLLYQIDLTIETQPNCLLPFPDEEDEGLMAPADEPGDYFKLAWRLGLQGRAAGVRMMRMLQGGRLGKELEGDYHVRHVGCATELEKPSEQTSRDEDAKRYQRGTTWKRIMPTLRQMGTRRSNPQLFGFATKKDN